MKAVVVRVILSGHRNNVGIIQRDRSDFIQTKHLRLASDLFNSYCANRVTKIPSLNVKRLDYSTRKECRHQIQVLLAAKLDALVGVGLAANLTHWWVVVRLVLVGVSSSNETRRPMNMPSSESKIEPDFG
jgi:hypothetical protein